MRCEIADEISASQLHSRLKQENPPLLIDVREPEELAIVRLSGGVSVPMATLLSRWDSLVAQAAESKSEIVLYCRSGCRTDYILSQLIELGLAHQSKKQGGETAPAVSVTHLAGGILGWVRDVDPSLPTY